MSLRDRMHVVVAGGGVASLETLLALRALAGGLVRVTLLSPTAEFVYRPVTVGEAFDRAEARVYDLAEILRGRKLLLAGGAELFVDRVITLPVLEGPRLPGLPHDPHGFIPVDKFGRVAGVEHVYAAGDVTTFPLKQGGLAAQQADAVAETIAAEAGAVTIPTPFRPVLRGLLLTGGAPLYLRAEPQRLHHEATVAIEAPSTHRPSRDASAAAGQALWWPPAKIAGRYMAPYLGQPGRRC